MVGGSGAETPAVVGRKTTASPATVGGRPSSGDLAAGMKRAISPGEEDYDAIINKRLKISKELVQLETYFYATLQGEAKFLEAEFKADMAFKCHVCKKVFMNNIEFMKHLHLHVESDRATAIDLADLTQCKYCYKAGFSPASFFPFSPYIFWQICTNMMKYFLIM